MIGRKEIPYCVFRGTEYLLLKSEYTSNIYWKVTPPIYRFVHSMTTRYGAPLDAFTTISVCPTYIIKHTGREDSSDYSNRRRFLGEVLAGNWDKTTEIADSRPECGVLADYVFDEMEFYKGLKQRYCYGEEWKETTLYQLLYDYLSKTETKWRNAETPDDLDQYLQRVDDLYETIATEGYRTQIELAKKGNTGRLGFIDHLTNEITVDIGRGGEILFVDGKHRLAIAKILDLEKVPVTVLVRHKKWMEYRDEVWNDPSMDASWHPDLQQPD